MEINIRGHETLLSDEVRDYTKDKILKLSKYGIEIITADIVLEEDHNKKKKTCCKAKMFLDIPGKNIEAVGESNNIFTAVNNTVDKATRQLSKNKKKLKNREHFAKSKDLIRKIFRRS